MSAEMIGLAVVAAGLAVALVLKGSGDPSEQHPARPPVLEPEQRFADVDELAARARRALRTSSAPPPADDEHAVDIGAI